jgi:hypothetical protein
MKSPAHILALACAIFSAAPARADLAASANYSMNISIEGGGQRTSSAAYAQDTVITPIAGRSVAALSDLLLFGFVSQLNIPPVALDDVRSHPLNAPVGITASSLLANDFDLDGDTLSLVTADRFSAAGGTVITSGQTITYTPPNGLGSADHFDYVVADSNGDIATATVTLGIAPPIQNQPLNTVAIVEQPDGAFLIRFRQQPGSTDYIIQFSHDLNDRNWQTLTDVHAGADGIVEVLVDPSVADQTYFRAVVL